MNAAARGAATCAVRSVGVRRLAPGAWRDRGTRDGARRTAVGAGTMRRLATRRGRAWLVAGFRSSLASNGNRTTRSRSSVRDRFVDTPIETRSAQTAAALSDT
ncbi:hypothetical protein [Burkholderia multivorans]|uniref:hypothetical protein n=1 Tax=Burkholderia multivorans TaxID=87883 RepID=UPI000CFE68B9|nr:hypothetical protein [Burkholderia multivorans]MBU9143376.1 hypothetical protein [Burkholderia multivorans]PRE05323.1 hypothetical protein C6P91_14470 [Burkholderia multivorans]